MDKKLNNNILLLILAVGVFGILNTEMGVIGILPMVALEYDIDIVTAGLLVSLFALGVAIAGPTMPLAFSRFNRKWVMVLVLSVFTICNIISVFAPNFTILLLARVIPAFLHPVYCALAFSVAAASVAKSEAPKAVAKINMGVAAGMVVGVPVSNFLAEQFSLSMAMGFFALVTGIMLMVTLLWVPSMPVDSVMTYGEQLGVLKRKNTWLAMLAVVFMNGSVFGVYNYLADYLGRVTMTDTLWCTALLFVYGLSNICGSYLGGNMLSKWPLKTVMIYPMLILIIYIFVLSGGGEILYFMAALTICWGILAGINGNINQFWLAKAVPDAPDFGNGLFLTSANIGCMAGTAFSGVFINEISIEYVFLGGMIFAVLAEMVLQYQKTVTH